MMDRLNNGKPFTGVEKAIAGYANEDIAIKTYIRLFRDEPCFDTKTVKEVYTGTTFDMDEAEKSPNAEKTFLETIDRWAVQS